MPNLFIIAGPNGAGKTTYARRFLTEEARCREFVNADLIAAGLSPFAPDKAAFAAGRIMLRRLRDLSAQRQVLLSRRRFQATAILVCCRRCARRAIASGSISFGFPV